MSVWLQKMTQGGWLLLLVVAICLGGYSSLLAQRLEVAQRQLREQQRSLAQQVGLVATLQTQEAQNRVLMTTQLQQEQQLRQQYSDYQRKYRDAIKHDACAEQPMPDAVFELLQPANTAGSATANPVAP